MFCRSKTSFLFVSSIAFASLYAASGFTSPTYRRGTKSITVDSTCRLNGSVSKWNEEHQYEEEDDELITREMFLRDGLEVRRKKKGSKEYKPHDNRDSLPFIVKVKTPDPYTPTDKMLKDAKKLSENASKQNKKSKMDTIRRSNLVGMDGKYANGIAASIFSRKSDGELQKILGQFELDKNTNCGDLLDIGEREFEVVKARAQFKYAGGKRFVMVRKILEVKEITRIAEEASLQRLMTKKDESSTGKSFE
mmetsp:Transcript_29117/g.43738  ORF Transcript_29117/g.43738 Transcript_29117/m.43738 type:complete len:250 (-) Transcript_29117:1435-2184(-)